MQWESRKNWLNVVHCCSKLTVWRRMIVLVVKARRTSEETAEPAASRGILLSSFLTCAAGRYSWKIQWADRRQISQICMQMKEKIISYLADIRTVPFYHQNQELLSNIRIECNHEASNFEFLFPESHCKYFTSVPWGNHFLERKFLEAVEKLKCCRVFASF